VFIVPFVSGPWQANCYLLSVQPGRPSDPQPAVVIDPGVATRKTIEELLTRHSLRLAGVLLTHGHIDHVADAAELANDHQVPVWLHPNDRAMLTQPGLGLGPEGAFLVASVLGSDRLPAPNDLRELSDGQQLELAGLGFEVLHSPGHTPGCVVLRSEHEGSPVLFSGDVLFAGSMGRVDLPGGSMAEMTVSLRRLRTEIDAATSILPGHGPATTMAAELANNPYLTQEILG
jgi:hydroxyacylglutathione hydrolase